MKFRLKNDESYKPPGTWDEVAALEHHLKVRACRYFMREAAIRLHEVAGMRLDDIISAFDSMPVWISSQLHAWKREQASKKNAWRCNNCHYIGRGRNFFTVKDQKQAKCPECGRIDASKIEVGIRVIRAVDDGVETRVASQESSGEGKTSFSVGKPLNQCCDGHPCPICQGQGEKNVPLIEDHHCSRCQTTFCSTCHGVKLAQLSRAYGDVGRCRCGGSDG